MKYIFFALLFIAFSCKPKQQKVTEKTYENGTPKVVSIYNGEKTANNKLEEISYHNNGKVFTQGKFKEQKKDGLWTSFYPNGSKWSETIFKDGLSEGKTTTWYDSGKIRYEGFYSKGEPSGVWKYWDMNGKVVFEKDYSKK